MSARAVVLAAARALLGTRFRLHGREPESGLDCVGLICVAFAHAGTVISAPSGYRLTSGRQGDFDHAAQAAGLVRAIDPEPGDAILCRIGARQWHLGIRSEIGLIHADAWLGRVVERPGAMPWPVISCWCCPDSI